MSGGQAAVAEAVQWITNARNALRAATAISERMHDTQRVEGLNLGNHDRLIEESAAVIAALATATPARLSDEDAVSDMPGVNGDVWTQHGHAWLPCSPPEAVWGQVTCILAARAVQPTPADGERCRRCGSPNVIWSTASPLWNYVMRGNDINGDTKYADLVCMPCFVILAVEAGLPEKGWRLTLVPEPEGLVYETPSGRVWDAERFLWVEPRPRYDPNKCGNCGHCGHCDTPDVQAEAVAAAWDEGAHFAATRAAIFSVHGQVAGNPYRAALAPNPGGGTDG